MLLFLAILFGIGGLFFLAHDPRFDEERHDSDKFATLLGVLVVSTMIAVLSLLLKGSI